jgi:Ca2+-binding RTX toxin-like protein
MFAVVGAALVVAFAGVALAAVITCTGGRCQGTNRPDQIPGSDQRDIVFALAGADQVEARTGDDQLDGGDGGDDLFGENNNDTYFGGRGDDILRESINTDTIISSNDEMNGGPNRDFIEGNEGDDILRGQEGSEHLGTTQATMFGDQGNDKLYGGLGEDAMQGEEGTDEHYGGDNNDYIDAASQETVATDAPDLVDCGGGTDTALRLPKDIVANCEQVINVSTTTVAPSTMTTNGEQVQQSESFLAGNG